MAEINDPQVVAFANGGRNPGRRESALGEHMGLIDTPSCRTRRIGDYRVSALDQYRQSLGCGVADPARPTALYYHVGAKTVAHRARSLALHHHVRAKTVSGPLPAREIRKEIIMALQKYVGSPLDLDPSCTVPFGVHISAELASRGATSIGDAVIKAIVPSGPITAEPYYSGTDLLCQITSGAVAGVKYSITWHYTDYRGLGDDVTVLINCVEM